MSKETMIQVGDLALPEPTIFTFGLMDITAESGRTMDAITHKNRIAQKRKLTLEWRGKTWEETAIILQAFNAPYVQLRYPDMLSGQYETRTFTVDDRSAPVWIWREKHLIEKVTFHVTER